MSIATDLQGVFTSLHNVLNNCNTALTGKGGAEVDALAGVPAAIIALPTGSGGGVELPDLENPALDSDVRLGKEYIDETGKVRTGTMEGSLPGWISECEVQTFTPGEDTSDPQTFSFNTLSKEPNVFILTCNAVSGSFTQLDFLAATWTRLFGGSVNAGSGYHVYARGPAIPYGQGAVSTVSVSGTAVTVNLPSYGTFGTTFWRAKYTYTLVALSLN